MKKITEMPENDSEKVPKEILVIAQEIKIVQSLACNNVNKRNRQMRKLHQWLKLRSQSSFPFTDVDFLRIWKGLYYNMWMSDKPLVQEELAEQIAKLLDSFEGNVLLSVNFFGAFLKAMCQEWFGIDQWRVDKFLMLVRRMLRNMFRVLKSSAWHEKSIHFFNDHLQNTVLAENNSAIGFAMHIIDIFFEELAKVSAGNISAEEAAKFVKPFVIFLTTQKDNKLVSHCQKRVFYHLLYQSSLGREYLEKYDVWKEMGFPATIDDLEKDNSVEMQDEDSSPGFENEIKQLDPRAGKVDVFVPELPLDANFIIKELKTVLFKYDLCTKRRCMIRNLINLFEIFKDGRFPLGIKRMPRYKTKSAKPLILDKVEKLEEMEEQLYGTVRKLKKLNKRKRRKLLKSINLENASELNFDEIIENAIPKTERQRKAQHTLMNSWVEEELTEEDIVPKKKAKLTNSNEKILQSNTPQKHKKENENSFLNTTDTKKQIESTTTNNTEITQKVISEWGKPLQDGEIEYFLPTRKIQIQKANSKLVRNPLAKSNVDSSPLIITKEKVQTILEKSGSTSSLSSTSEKRVKIALKHNTSQNPIEYIRHVKSSPNIPYDANRKPIKSLLKPNSLPSPINPFYKKKIGLKLFNDTL